MATVSENAPPRTSSGRRRPYDVEPERHDVRFYGAGDGPMRAVCEPCKWRVGLEGGHDAADLARLTAMHSGEIS